MGASAGAGADFYVGSVFKIVLPIIPNGWQRIFRWKTEGVPHMCTYHCKYFSDLFATSQAHFLYQKSEDVFIHWPFGFRISCVESPSFLQFLATVHEAGLKMPRGTLPPKRLCSIKDGLKWRICESVGHSYEWSCKKICINILTVCWNWVICGFHEPRNSNMFQN